MDSIATEIEKNGFAAVPGCISEDNIAFLTDAIDAGLHGSRNLLANSTVRRFGGA
jgi:hypothetical protein